jgi:hypothetical protein
MNSAGSKQDFASYSKLPIRLGGVLFYSDHRGYGGDSLYSNSCATIFTNGELESQGHQFDLEEVEIVTSTVDLGSVEVCHTNHKNSDTLPAPTAF